MAMADCKSSTEVTLYASPRAGFSLSFPSLSCERGPSVPLLSGEQSWVPAPELWLLPSSTFLPTVAPQLQIPAATSQVPPPESETLTWGPVLSRAQEMLRR